MSVEYEITSFDMNSNFLKPKIRDLASRDVQNATENDLFLAEAIAFRIYRSYERFARALFLHGCTSDKTQKGTLIVSKLQCENWEEAEKILKARNRFLEWGDPEFTSKLAGLVFKNGFPMKEAIGPIHGTLIDLRRVRNFIAHDSPEAKKGFKKVIQNYVPTGSVEPDNAGKLLLSRKRRDGAQAIRKIFERVAALSTIYAAL